MGWFRDNPWHEGFSVGLIHERSAYGASRLRPLTLAEDRDRQIPPGGLPVTAFQIGCTCGWRSPIFYAPAGARWHPSVITLGDDQLEDAAWEIWSRHYDAEEKADYTPFSLREVG
jgi:hypothetical protein